MYICICVRGRVCVERECVGGRVCASICVCAW